MSPKALIATQPGPCFVCEDPTRRIRSMTHLDGPPTDPKDHVRICLECDPEWTAALTNNPGKTG